MTEALEAIVQTARNISIHGPEFEPVHFIYTDSHDYKYDAVREGINKRKKNSGNKSKASSSKKTPKLPINHYHFNPEIETGAVFGLTLLKIAGITEINHHSVQTRLNSLHMVELGHNAYDVHYANRCNDKSHETGEDLRKRNYAQGVAIANIKDQKSVEEEERHELMERLYYTSHSMAYLTSRQVSESSHRKVVWRLNYKLPKSSAGKIAYSKKIVKVDNLIDAVFEAIEQGETLTYSQAVRNSGLTYVPEAKRLLNELDLSSSDGIKSDEYHIISETDRGKYELLHSSVLSAQETLYFMKSKYNRSTINNIWKKIGPRPWFKFKNQGGDRMVIDYVKASQFLDAIDCRDDNGFGFSLEEAAQIAGIGYIKAQKVLSLREAITKHITFALNIIEPRVEHTKPYIDNPVIIK